MRAYIEQTIKLLVNTPEEVIVEETTPVKSRTMVFKIKVKQGEACFLIGKRGGTADALRLLFNSIARKSDQRIVLDIEGDTYMDRSEH